MRSPIYLRVMRLLRPVVFPLLCLASLVFLGDAAHAQSNDADYGAFKEKVQPIFLKARSTHGRCVTCHGGGNGGGFVLQPLSPGAVTWDEEQTRKNYFEVSQLVSPGKPESSQLLMHPLAPEAGGDVFHSGGHQFSSQADPDWQTLADWVRQKGPFEYKNLKVLSSGENLLDVMRTFNLSLREECNFCHTPPDFASDARPMKNVAREMMKMTSDLNSKLGNGTVTCYTCHRGDERPRTVHPRFPNLKYPK
jgi:hypothetical protein